MGKELLVVRIRPGEFLLVYQERHHQALGGLPQQVSQGDLWHHCTTAKDRAPQQCTNCQAVWDGGEYGRPDYSKETEVVKARCMDG